MTAAETFLWFCAASSQSALPALRIDGHVFAQANGAPWTAIECSDFNLLGRYLTEGADAIRPVLAQRQAAGFNLLRVWTRYQGPPPFEQEIGRLLPSEHPDLYARLPAFCALCAGYGLYLELTAYTGGSRDDHWDRLGEGLGQMPAGTVLVELINEADSYPHDIHVADFSPLPGVWCSHGSNGSEAVPPRPPWQYETFHTNDAFEWWRKAGHNAMELSDGSADGTILPSHVPVLTNENTRYPDRDASLTHAFDAAAGAALLCAGSCFHSVAGKRSALWTEPELAAAQAWAAGARAMNLRYQHGVYRHAEELETAGILRAYQRVLTDGSRETVMIRA